MCSHLMPLLGRTFCVSDMHEVGFLNSELFVVFGLVWIPRTRKVDR